MSDDASIASTLVDTYEGIEAAGSFADTAALAAYRAAALHKTVAQVELLRRQLACAGRSEPAAPAGKLLEIGCGNGRLAIALAHAGLIDSALGLDLARSRIAFAEAWAADLGLDASLEFRAADALAHQLAAAEYSIAACITGAFAYFDAYTPGSSALLLSDLHRSLRPGGLLLLELYPHPRERRLLLQGDGQIKLWTELPDTDPWRFYLSDLRLQARERDELLLHSKTFIHRTSAVVDQGRSERLVLYSPNRITELLEQSGFSDVLLRDGWSDEPYVDGELMVVTAQA